MTFNEVRSQQTDDEMAKLSMDKFDSKLEDFESYVERLEHYFTAAEITENKLSFTSDKLH